MTGIVQTLIGGFGAVAAAVTDAYFNLVTLLLPGNGTNGAQNNTFLDSSSNNFTITRNGNTTQGTFSPFSQTGWGNYFDGNGDYLQTTMTQTVSGNYTFECWIYLTAAYSSTRACMFGDGGSGAWEFDVDGSAGAWNKLNIYFGGAGITPSATINTNTWYHVAVVRNGTTTTAYLNGTSIGTSTGMNGSVSTSTVRIGRLITSYDYYFPGYISNLRFVNGSAVYTGAFTPSTSALTAVTNTTLLTCQSNRFVDNSSGALTLTPNGDVSVQAFSPFAPTAAYSASTNGGSGYFDGTGDSLSIANATAIQVGATYTIEGWFYPTSSSQLRYFGKFTSGVGGWLLLADSSTFTWYYANAGSSTITGSWSPRLNSWNHIAVSANSTTMRVYLNGASIGSVSSPASTQDDGSNLLIGDYNGTGGVPFLGYINGFRIVKGSTVYDPSQTTLTVPTAPLTAITNTSLLLNFTNAGIVDSTAKNVLETVGNAQISTTQSKFGGSSMYFDGTGDYLDAPQSDLYSMRTGNFTLEFWIYFSSTSGTQVIYTGRNTTTPYIQLNSGALQFGFSGGPDNVINYTWNPSATTWYHVAFVRSSGTLSLYINGTSVASASNSTDWATPAYARIAANNSGASAFNGYLDDFRLTKGYARYTSNFTAPTAAFPLQ